MCHRTLVLKAATVSILVLGAGCHTDDGLEAYDQAIQQARSCSSGDECVVAGGLPGCRCPMAVRADEAESVALAAQEAECPENERLACATLEDPRCEDGTCVATQVVE